MSINDSATVVRALETTKTSTQRPTCDTHLILYVVAGMNQEALIFPACIRPVNSVHVRARLCLVGRNNLINIFTY